MSRLFLAVSLILVGTVVAGAEPQAPAPRRIPVEALTRGQKFAKQGRVDLFIASTAAWKLKPDDARLWRPAVDLGRLLIEKAELKGDRKPLSCPSDYPTYAAYVRRKHPRFTRVDELYSCPDPQKNSISPVLPPNEAIQAAGVVSPAGILNALIVSRGGVQSEKPISQSVIFATGDVRSMGWVNNTVIVCDGDVTVNDAFIDQSLVVACGNITVKGWAVGATLIAGGKVSLGKQTKPDRNQFNIIKENEPNPLGFITFFELSTVGLEVKVVDGAVQVSKVAAGKAAEKAELKADDVILEVAGKKPTNAESLRRLLRDALALGDATVKLKRGDKTETVKVVLPE